MIEYDWLLGFGKKVYVRIDHELEKNDLQKSCTNHGSLPAQIHRDHLQRTRVDQVILTRDSAQI